MEFPVPVSEILRVEEGLFRLLSLRTSVPVFEPTA
jgi:hypothetical protein